MEFFLDHIIYFTRDIEGSAQLLRQQGFHVVAGGRHLHWGSHNALVQFGLTYFEILGLWDWQRASQATVGTAAQAILDLPHGNGLGRFVLRTRDLDEVARAWREQGFKGIRIMPGERQRPDGQTLRWRLLFPPWAQDRSFPMPFVIEWENPDDLRQQDLIRSGALAAHANEIERVIGVASAVRDVEEICRRFEALYGATREAPLRIPELGRDTVVRPLRLPNATVFFYEGDPTERGERPTFVFLERPSMAPDTVETISAGPFRFIVRAPAR